MKHVIEKMNLVPHSEDAQLKVLEISPHVDGMIETISDDFDEYSHDLDDAIYEAKKAEWLMHNDISGNEDWEDDYKVSLAPEIADVIMGKKEMYMYVIYWHNPNGEDAWEECGMKYTEKMHEEECGWMCGWEEIDIDDVEDVMFDMGIDELWMIGDITEDDDWDAMDLGSVRV